jgi:hypothetical protein
MGPRLAETPVRLTGLRRAKLERPGKGVSAPPGDLGEPRVVDCPSAPASQAPNLAVGLDGSVYLSWVEPTGDGDALRFSTWRDGQWTTPKTVAEEFRWRTGSG